MNHQNLLALNILKKGRLVMIDKIKTDLSVQKAMFKYESNNIAMKLVVEKFMVEWIDLHFELLEKERAFFNQEEIKIALCSLKELIIDDCVNDFDIGLYNKLLSEKRRIIANLLVSEEKMEQNFNKLLLSYERDKAFFEREMEKFFNVRNG